MLKLLARKVNHRAAIMYRGTLTPRAEEYAFLMKQGIDVKLSKKPEGDSLWTLFLRHPVWGEARLMGLRDYEPMPRRLLEFTRDLTDHEKDAAAATGCAVGLVLASARDNILRDRKNLFRFARQVMSDDAVVAADANSMLHWTRAALDDELSTDADLDVSALYCIHAVFHEGSHAHWLHTHGIAEVGGFDIDVLGPSESIVDGCGDLFRAAAYGILDGDILPDSPKVQLAHPGGTVRMVPATEFHSRASKEHQALRDPDEFHMKNRSIMCEPARGLFASRKAPRPSEFLAEADTDGMMILFPTAATEAMAKRARETVGTLKLLMQELSGYDLPVLAKIGYPRDDGEGGEHMWFSVHGFDGDSIDATLESQPFDIKSMNRGDRGLHSTSKLTEWTIMTPLGSISSHAMTTARRIREDPEAFAQLMKKLKGD